MQAVPPRLPADVVVPVARIRPDEEFHLRRGATVVRRCRVTHETRHRVRRTFEPEQTGPAASGRRVVRRGLADVDQPTRPPG